MKIKRNDKVKILYGKDAGKTGKVVKILPVEGKVVVEGLNIFKRHLKGDGRKRKSEIADIVKPMNVAKVQLICPSCNKPTRLKMQKGERFCKKCEKKIGVETEKKEESKKKTKTSKKE